MIKRSVRTTKKVNVRFCRSSTLLPQNNRNPNIINTMCVCMWIPYCGPKACIIELLRLAFHSSLPHTLILIVIKIWSCSAVTATTSEMDHHNCSTIQIGQRPLFGTLSEWRMHIKTHVECRWNELLYFPILTNVTFLTFSRDLLLSMHFYHLIHCSK